MKCPYCIKEMQKGSIMQAESFRPITWLPDDRDKSIKAFFVKQGIQLTSTINPFLTVYYCEECKKFLINQEDIDSNSILDNTLNKCKRTISNLSNRSSE